MVNEHLWLGFEVDHLSLRVHVFHVVEETGSASSAADDHILKLRYLVKHVVLYAAEGLLTLFGEDLCHGLVAAALYVPVEVVEGHIQLLGQGAADGGLASTHVAYQYYPCHSAFTPLLTRFIQSS